MFEGIRSGTIQCGSIVGTLNDNGVLYSLIFRPDGSYAQGVSWMHHKAANGCEVGCSTWSDSQNKYRNC